ncbi:MAG: glycine betaine/proline transport system substrate-binding protein [Alteromonadaceae bacterium]|jgi:glycine betaine/proline transport system substrate-binding protein
MHSKTKPMLLIFIVFSLLIYNPSHATKAKSEEPIKIILNDWTSQLVLSHITAGIFRDMGYAVVFTQKSTSTQWGSLQRGLDHVQMEVWQGTMEKMYTRMIKRGGIIDAGFHDATTREEWWFPDYVLDVCPGLPDWQALNRCSHLFVTKETSPRGRYLGGPWEKPDGAKIRALELNFKVVIAKNSDALWEELDKAIKNKQPIVLFNWTPNWVEAKYKGQFVEFPDYHPDCETIPEWGENKRFLHDCGNPKNGWLKKIAWHQMPKKWPCAFNTLTQINFSNAMLADLAYEVDVKNFTYQQVAKQWLADNQDKWKSWISSSCQVKNKEMD